MEPGLFTIRAARVTRGLAIIAGLLLAASVALQTVKHLTGRGRLFGLVNFFYVDGEENAPTLFSVAILLIAAVLLTLVAALERRTGRGFPWGWAGLAAGFAFMAIDEAFSLHEQLVEPMRSVLKSQARGIFYFAWVIPGALLVAAIGLIYSRFLFRLPADTRLRFCIAAALYLGGTIGVELIAGAYAETHGLDTYLYTWLATLEEGLEMAGVIMFIDALMRYIIKVHGRAQFQLAP